MFTSDTHMHTLYSHHGEGTVDQLCRSALAKGFDLIAITEHLTLPDFEDPERHYSMAPEEQPIYIEQIEEARALYPRLRILCGCEVDWRQGEAALQWIDQWSEPFQIKLGSVHMVPDDKGNSRPFDSPGNPEVWQELGPDEVWRRYFRLWQDAAASHRFDIMSHPDLPKKLGFYPSFDLGPYYQQMAQTAAAADVLVEVNTSGLRYKVGEMYPNPELLREFNQAGVGCAIGSDAHDPALVGADFDKGYQLLRDCGYREITVPLGGGERKHIALG
ncbi:MAG: histidinol-phosphatase HisJ family protein [Coriobacteriales bacterium]|jgi:histidinol-phosphatase (PHP family)|nr:histidinol-phosphatase HisJ family protein [Coriobacteriales bacterium]